MNLKNNYLLNKLLKWTNKNSKKFSISNVVFKKKKKKKTLGDIIILPKNQNFEKSARDIITLHPSQKN